MAHWLACVEGLVSVPRSDLEAKELVHLWKPTLELVLPLVLKPMLEQLSELLLELNLMG